MASRAIGGGGGKPSGQPTPKPPAWLENFGKTVTNFSAGVTGALHGGTSWLGNVAAGAARGINRGAAGLGQGIASTTRGIPGWLTRGLSAPPGQRLSTMGSELVQGAQQTWNNMTWMSRALGRRNPAPWLSGSKEGLPQHTPYSNWDQENPGLAMTPDEYLRRRDRLSQKLFPKEWADYLARAAEAGARGESMAAWQESNPRPDQGFWQTPQEYIVRNNAAPPGYFYQPFGSSYGKIPQMPSQGTNTPSPSAGSNGYGSGWGWGYGGGGGGGGGGYQDAREWYNNMVQWSINQANRGG